MKKYRIEPRQIHIQTHPAHNGGLILQARPSIEVHGALSHEATTDARAINEIEQQLVRAVLQRIYGDVWDLAHYARKLITRDSTLGPDHPAVKMLKMIEAIGQEEIEIEDLLAPYRHPSP
jgi:hypothetical protein